MTLHELLFLAATVFVVALYVARVVVRRSAPPPRTVEDLARDVIAGLAELRVLAERAHGRLDEQRVYVDARAAEIDRLLATVADMQRQIDRLHRRGT